MRRFQQALIGLYAVTVMALAVLFSFILTDGLHSPWAILTWTSVFLSFGLMFGILMPMIRYWRLMPSAIWKTHITDKSVTVHSDAYVTVTFIALNLLMLFPIFVYYQPEITGGSPNLLAILISTGSLVLTVVADAWFIKYFLHGTTIELTKTYLLAKSGTRTLSIIRFDDDTIIRANAGKKSGLSIQNAKRTAHREKFFSSEMTQRTDEISYFHLNATSFGEKGFVAACKILNIGIEYPASRNSKHYY